MSIIFFCKITVFCKFVVQSWVTKIAIYLDIIFSRSQIARLKCLLIDMFVNALATIGNDHEPTAPHPQMHASKQQPKTILQ